MWTFQSAGVSECLNQMGQDAAGFGTVGGLSRSLNLPARPFRLQLLVIGEKPSDLATNYGQKNVELKLKNVSVNMNDSTVCSESTSSHSEHLLRPSVTKRQSRQLHWAGAPPSASASASGIQLGPLRKARANALQPLSQSLNSRGSRSSGLGAVLLPAVVARRQAVYDIASRHALHRANVKKRLENCVYEVSVCIGPQASTWTPLSLRLVGRVGRVPRQTLHATIQQMPDGTRVRYQAGSTYVFRIRGHMIAHLNYAVIELESIARDAAVYVEYVRVLNLRTNAEWLLDCSAWLSLYHDDCQISRQLFANTNTVRKSASTKNKSAEYSISVETGRALGAGTDANVYLTLFGGRAQTAKLPLNRANASRSNNKNLFERGHTDLFTVKASDVGKVDKIRLEHDNTGVAAGWLCEQVTVTRLGQPKHTATFSCHKWLDDNDGQLWYDLVAGSSRLCQYDISVHTGSVRGAGTDANVYLSLFGSTGHSDEMQLRGPGNLFEAGSVDRFQLQLAHVGRLNKLRVRHDNAGLMAGWYLDKIVVLDGSDNQEYVFHCDKWLSESEGDGAISRELYTREQQARQHRDKHVYTVSLLTADQPNAGTNANVHLQMFSDVDPQNETSGRIVLPGRKLARGSTEVFKVDVSGLYSPLTSLLVGHDNAGSGPGWKLRKAIVQCAATGIEQHFVCNRWLAADEDDGLIERTLQEDTRLRLCSDIKEDSWLVSVHTGECSNAGTSSNVCLVAYGLKGEHSAELELSPAAGGFDRGSVEECVLQLPQHIRTLTKLRIGHDNKGVGAGWFLHKVEMYHRRTGRVYEFLCDRWLAEDEGDGELVVELPATGPGIRHPLQELQYTVAVHTGDVRGAGTDANVWCCVQGALGDTGRRPLNNSAEHTNKFERKNIDTFRVNAVELGELTGLRIGHDGSGLGAGWYLQKVVVSYEDQHVVFPCGRWLASDEDDGLLERHLLPGRDDDQQQDLLKLQSFEVRVATGDVKYAGTGANVHVCLLGSEAESGRLQLTRPSHGGQPFQRGRTDVFSVETAPLGQLRQLVIGHDGTGVGSGWYLATVEVIDQKSNVSYWFEAERWLAADEHDGNTQCSLEPRARHDRHEQHTAYELTVVTGDVAGAGTDARIAVQLFGDRGSKTRLHPLTSEGDAFERGCTDVFKINDVPLGRIVKMRLESDGHGRAAGWFCHKVVVRTKKENTKKSGKDSPTTTEEFVFPVDEWFERSGELVREFVPESNGHQLAACEYELRVHTSDVRGAGTDAKVYVTLYGSNGTDTGERWLQHSQTNTNKFERNSTDVFRLAVCDLGEVERVKVWHDNAGLGAAWHLHNIQVVSNTDHKTWTFECNDWLSASDGDGQICRDLLPMRKEGSRGNRQLEKAPSLCTYTVSTLTGTCRGAGTDANVFVTLYGSEADTGRMQLKTSSQHFNKFEAGNTDTFQLQAVRVGQLNKIIIEQDGANLFSDWFLASVEVTGDGRRWLFPCHKWLAADKDDGQLFKELYPEEETVDEPDGKEPVDNLPSTFNKQLQLREAAEKQSMAKNAASVPLNVHAREPVQYRISVHTGDVWRAGTDANVHVNLHGDGGDSGPIPLKRSATHTNKFERGKVDVFDVDCRRLGDLTGITIGHDNSSIMSNWYLAKVEVIEKASGQTWRFVCDQWLAKGKGDGHIERHLLVDH